MIRFAAVLLLVAMLDAAEMVVTGSGEEIFPEAWRGGKVAASGEMLSDQRREESLRVMDAALAKYPAEVLREHLHVVYLLGELRYRGVITSGTNSKTSVYVKIGSPEKGFTPQHNEGVFHAEFSSILLRNRAEFLDQTAWKAANPPRFAYLGNGVDAVRQGKARTTLDDSLNACGFLSEYGQSTLENDFNSFAARLWTGDAAVWKLASQHSSIQRKLCLILRFYQQIHPKLDEKHFRQLITGGDVRSTQQVPD